MASALDAGIHIAGLNSPRKVTPVAEPTTEERLAALEARLEDWLKTSADVAGEHEGRIKALEPHDFEVSVGTEDRDPDITYARDFDPDLCDLCGKTRERHAAPS